MERQQASLPPEFLDEAARSVEEDEEDACSGAAGWARFGSVILRRGCTLGKEAVVASAALTSAPFVLPPLVFASAVSVALSLPFGVYLVSMACTERLMESLLPPPRTLSYEPDDDFGAAKEEENDNISVEEGEAIKEHEVMVLVDGVDSGNETVGNAYETKAVVRTSAVKTEEEESTDDSIDEFFSDAYPHTVESISEKYEISMDGEDIGDTPGGYLAEEVNPEGKDGNEVQTADEKDDPKKEEEKNDLGGSLNPEINKDLSSGGISVIGSSAAKVGMANLVGETGMRKKNGGEDYSEAAAVCEEEPVLCITMSLTPEEEEVSSFCVKNSIEKIDDVSAIEELVSVAERIKEEEMEGETIADIIASQSEIAVVLEKVIRMEEFLLKDYKEEEKIEDKAAIETEIVSFNSLPTDGRDLSSSKKLQEDEGTIDITLVEEEQVQVDIFASPMNKESIVSPSNSIDVISIKMKPTEELISLGERNEEEDVDQKEKQDKETLSFKCLLTYDGSRSSTLLEHQGKTIEERQLEKEEKLDINIAAASPKSKQSLVSPPQFVDVISYKMNSTVKSEEREKEEDTKLDKGMDRTAFNNEKTRVTFMPEEMELKIQPSCLSLIDPYTDDQKKSSTETLQEDLVMRITETTQVEQRKEVDTEISVDMILASIEESGKEEDTKLEKEMHKTASNDERPYFIFVPEEMELKMQPSCLDLVDPNTGDGEKNSTKILQEVRVMRITESTQAEQRKEVDIEIPINMICDINQMEEMVPLEQKDEENIEEELRADKAASETDICISTQAEERESEISCFNLNINYLVTDHIESNLYTQEKTTVERSILVMEKAVVRPPKNTDANNETDDHVAEVSIKYYGETDQSSISSEYVSAAEDLSTDIAETESKSSVEHLLQKAEPVVAASTGETTVVPSANEAPPSQSQALYSEEQMWHQIAALRIILGCKATLSSSISEELKALYILTGLEPPEPFKDTADLVELSHKLLFLKVVIGVE